MLTHQTTKLSHALKWDKVISLALKLSPVQYSSPRLPVSAKFESNVMAHTARNEDEKKEFFDSPEALDKKASHVVDMIRKSKHFIAFTVSTRESVVLR